MDIAFLREQFPVFERLAYLNAGTCGPVPAAALRAAADVGLAAAERGRAGEHFDLLADLRERLRAAYAALLGAEPRDVAIATCASEGMARVVGGLGLRSGDEVLTAPDEHPGLLGPLAAARRALGIEVRTVPLRDIADAVGPRTRLVACSHVSWITGEPAPAALARLGDDVPVLFDGAQGVGAIPVDVARLGCAFYAGAGQKWLCGPVGTGMLYVAPAWHERLAPLGPTYPNLVDPYGGLDARLHEGARRHDAWAVNAETFAAAVAAHDTLESVGWDVVHDRARGLAGTLAATLAERGLTVAPRGDTTLVTWEADDPRAVARRLADEGVVLRALPGTPYVRASVGAWNDDSDIDRLLAAIA
jgi:L-cysteine/cystine lyase